MQFPISKVSILFSAHRIQISGAHPVRAPLWTNISLISQDFSENIIKIPPRDWCPLLGEVLDPPLLMLILSVIPLRGGRHHINHHAGWHFEEEYPPKAKPRWIFFFKMSTQVMINVMSPDI